MHLLNNCSVCLFVCFPLWKNVAKAAEWLLSILCLLWIINNDVTLYFPIINRDSSTEKETTDDERIPDISKQRKQRKYDPEM